MAKITHLPSQAIIDGLAGVLDFYVYHPVSCQGEGIPCVRKWPRYDESHMTQAAKDARVPFAYIATKWKTLPPYIQQAYIDMASQSSLTGKDMMIRLYLNASKA